MRRTDPEISDLIVDYDPDTLERRPVEQGAVADRFWSLGNSAAARIVSSLPAPGNVLDPHAVDRMLLRCHAELQRLSEEFQQGLRVRGLLMALLNVLRRQGAPRPIRIVDVGCGLGYVLRWLAGRGELGDDVELIGCDYNKALLDAARDAAEAEHLRCRFVLGNAFALEQPAAIYTSTGVIHHFRDEGLVSFFANQAGSQTQAFLHFDIQPSWAAPVGAWIFHRARMREPLARHDGVLSALRSHPGDILLDAATKASSDFSVALYDVNRSVLPVTRVLRPIIGIRPEMQDDFRAELGPDALRLEPWR